jgi:CDP-4-dehydro-6-deoxyglucose reductase, E1
MDKMAHILQLVDEYIKEKRANETWTPGKDWLAYSGPLFDGDEYKAAIESLLSEWLIFGKTGRDFELEFPKYLNCKYGALTNSGSSANLLMMSVLKSKKLFDLKPGAKFITPVVGFPTTINPIIQNGFTPVFVDVQLPDINLNLDEMEKVLKEDPEIKGLIYAHTLGNPPDMDRLMSLVEKYDLIFLEDCCDALGSTYDGNKLGSYGLMSSVSFFPAHHMTMGEGGFVGTNSGKVRQLLSSHRDWGRACYCNTMKPGDVTCETACGNRFQNWLPQVPDMIYDHRYVFDEIGYNLKPIELQAAMGLQQLKKLDWLDSARRENHKKLFEVFKPYEEFFHMPVATPKADPNWFAFLLTMKDGAPFQKQDLIWHLEGDKIQTRSFFSGNILYHPGYAEYAGQYENLQERFPIAHQVTKSSFFLGTYAGIDDEKIAYIKQSVDQFMKQYNE